METQDSYFIPSSYSRLAARELDLQERDLPRLLQGTGLEDAFECIVSEDDIKASKPDPEGFCVTLKRLTSRTTRPPDPIIAPTLPRDS